MTRSTITIQDIIEKVEAGAIVYSEQNRRRVLASLRRCSTLYENRHPSQIVVDPDSFRARWGKGRVTTVPSTFSTRAAFSDWRSNVRGAIDAATGVAAMRAELAGRDDGWAALRRALAPHIGGPRAPVFEKSLIGFDRLARLAREAGRGPLDVDMEWAQATHDALEPDGRKTFRGALALLGRVHTLTGIAGLAPSAPITLTWERRAEPRAVRIPPSIAEPLEAWLAARARGTRVSGYTELAINPLSPATIKSYRTGIEWYADGLRTFGLADLDAAQGPQDIADPSLLWRLVAAEIDGETATELTPHSLRNYLSSAAYFLQPYAPQILAERKLMLKLPYFEGLNGMTPAIREWCRDLIRSPDKQYAFLSAPATLFARAVSLMDMWDGLDFHQRADALRIAVVAASMAITTRLPLRVSNLVGLTLRGPGQQLFLPSRRQSPARIMLAADNVKNRRPIHADLLDTKIFSPADIMRWFAECARPRLAAGYEIDPAVDDRLFPGLTYNRYLRFFTRTMAELDLSMTPHRCRHALASILLAINPTCIREVAELLGDNVATVEKHYGWIDRGRIITDAQTIAADALRVLGRSAGLHGRRS